MKKINLFLSFTLLLFLNVTGQDWKLGGNTDATPPPSGLITNSNYFGGTETANVRLGTGNISRIFIGGTTFANPGFIGMGNSFLTPEARLHLSGDGGFLSSNNTFGLGAVIPAGLSNSLLIWNPKKASFRAGYDNTSSWSDINTGNYSAAFGKDNICSGELSFSIGELNNVSGTGSFAGGNGNVVTAGNSFAFGGGNILNGLSYVFGGGNVVNSGGSIFVAGISNTINDNGNYTFGLSNVIDGKDAFTFGEGNTVTTNSTGWSVTMGTGNENDAFNSFALGSFIKTSGNKSIGIGERLLTTTTAINSLVFGKGFDPSNPLTNNLPNTFMVGFNSDVPTFTIVSPVTPGIGATGRVGIGTTNPQNTLEITSNTAFPSGLQLTLLTSSSTPVINPGTGVLSVDPAGNVILVPDGGGTATLNANNGASVMNISGTDYVQWGQLNSGNGSLNGGELLHNTEIPFNNFNVFFNDPSTQTAGQNRVQIGSTLAINSLPQFTKLSVINNENSSIFRIAGFFSTSANVNFSGVPLQYNPFYFGSITLNTKFALVGIAQDMNDPVSRYVGITGGAYSFNSINNVGVSGKSYGSPNENYGVQAKSSSNNVTSNNYGIFAESNGGAYSVAGYFAGDIDGFGSFNYLSDINLKQDIVPISNANEVLSNLNPVSFQFNNSVHPQMNLDSDTHFGVLAQNADTVLPEIVKESVFPAVYDSAGNIIYNEVNYKSVNYDGIIPYLIAGYKYQKNKIDSLTLVTSSLASQINSCCNENRSSLQNENIIEITLSDVKSIVLDQNVPNPFAEMTAISFTLSEGIQKAQMLFYNIEGKLINSVDLSNKSGKGQLNVFANDLSNGIYTYTLVVDGKIIDTKKMIKQ